MCGVTWPTIFRPGPRGAGAARRGPGGWGGGAGPAPRGGGRGGRRAAAGRRVDEAVPRTRWEENVAARAAELAARSSRPRDVAGIELTPLDKTRTGDAISYRYVSARLDHA